MTTFLKPPQAINQHSVEGKVSNLDKETFTQNTESFREKGLKELSLSHQNTLLVASAVPIPGTNVIPFPTSPGAPINTPLAPNVIPGPWAPQAVTESIELTTGIGARSLLIRAGQYGLAFGAGFGIGTIARNVRGQDPETGESLPTFGEVFDGLVGRIADPLMGIDEQSINHQIEQNYQEYLSQRRSAHAPVAITNMTNVAGILQNARAGNTYNLRELGNYLRQIVEHSDLFESLGGQPYFTEQMKTYTLDQVQIFADLYRAQSLFEALQDGSERAGRGELLDQKQLNDLINNLQILSDRCERLGGPAFFPESTRREVEQRFKLQFDITEHNSMLRGADELAEAAIHGQFADRKEVNDFFNKLQIISDRITRQGVSGGFSEEVRAHYTTHINDWREAYATKSAFQEGISKISREAIQGRFPSREDVNTYFNNAELFSKAMNNQGAEPFFTREQRAEVTENINNWRKAYETKHEFEQNIQKLREDARNGRFASREEVNSYLNGAESFSNDLVRHGAAPFFTREQRASITQEINDWRDRYTRDSPTPRPTPPVQPAPPERKEPLVEIPSTQTEPEITPYEPEEEPRQPANEPEDGDDVQTDVDPTETEPEEEDQSDFDPTYPDVVARQDDSQGQEQPESLPQQEGRDVSPEVDQLVTDLGLSTEEGQQLIETLRWHWKVPGAEPTELERFISSERSFQEIVIEAVRTPDARVEEVTTHDLTDKISVEAAEEEGFSPQEVTEVLKDDIHVIRDEIISLIGPERIAKLHSSPTKPETVDTTIAQSITPYGTLIQGGRAGWESIARTQRGSTAGQDTSNSRAQQRGEFSENLAHFLIECGFDNVEVLTADKNSVADARGYDFAVVVQTANGKEEIYAFDAKSSIRGINDKISTHLRLGIQNTSKDHREKFEHYLETVAGGAEEAADLKRDLLAGNYIEWVAPGTRGEALQRYLHNLPEHFQMIQSNINWQINNYLRNALSGNEIEQEAAENFIADAAVDLRRTEADLKQSVLNNKLVEWISPQSSPREISDYLQNLPRNAHIKYNQERIPLGIPVIVPPDNPVVGYQNLASALGLPMSEQGLDRIMLVSDILRENLTLSRDEIRSRFTRDGTVTEKEANKLIDQMISHKLIERVSSPNGQGTRYRSAPGAR
jgi:hypothetical protein